MPHVRNKRSQSKSTEKVKIAIKEVVAAADDSLSFNHSERRNAIYIDEF
jgi:hypothetical protein